MLSREQDLAAAADKSFDQLLADHVAAYQPLFDRVKIDLGTTAEADRPTDERVKHFAEGHDPALAAPRVSVRPVPADLLLAPRRSAGDVAGTLERVDEPAVERQVHGQHQHRDELLAGGEDQPARMHRAAVRHDQGRLASPARTPPR